MILSLIHGTEAFRVVDWFFYSYLFKFKNFALIINTDKLANHCVGGLHPPLDIPLWAAGGLYPLMARFVLP